MRQVTYVGGADRRIIRERDWGKWGLTEEETVWNGRGDSVELSNEKADKLVEMVPAEFTIRGVGEEDEPLSSGPLRDDLPENVEEDEEGEDE